MDSVLPYALRTDDLIKRNTDAEIDEWFDNWEDGGRSPKDWSKVKSHPAYNKNYNHLTWKAFVWK